jgi:hypothetical protein
VIDDEIKALQEKAKKVIAESQRLRREHEVLLKQMSRLNEQPERLRSKEPDILDSN